MQDSNTTDDERVTVDEVLAADLQYGDEITIIYTIPKLGQRDRRHPLMVTVQGPPVVETVEGTDYRIVKLAVRKRHANYETYSLIVTHGDASVYSGDPSHEESQYLGAEAVIEIENRG